jgi:hypothetical protein
MQRGCHSSTHVRLEVHGVKRHFIVEYNAAGEILRIKERRVLHDKLMDLSFWVASSHVLGNAPDTIPKRVIALAHAQKDAAAR